jgi:hypothetical protein
VALHHQHGALGEQMSSPARSADQKPVPDFRKRITPKTQSPKGRSAVSVEKSGPGRATTNRQQGTIIASSTIGLFNI